MASGGKRPGAGRPKGSKTKRTPVGATLHGRVALLVADGMDEATISAVLGVPADQLRAEYGHELAHGISLVRADQLAALAASAAGGNAAAAKALLAIAGKPEAEKPARSAGRPDLATRALRILDGGRK